MDSAHTSMRLRSLIARFEGLDGSDALLCADLERLMKDLHTYETLRRVPRYLKPANGEGAQPTEPPPHPGNGEAIHMKREDVRAGSNGVKFDDGKPRFDLLAPDAMLQLVKVLTAGAAKKYDAHNWCKGMDWSRPYAAMLRHLNAWHQGETYDPETGLPHLAHAMCNVMFLLSFELRSVGANDVHGPQHGPQGKPPPSKDA